MKICGKMITCWDYLKRPCLRPAGHTEFLHNPFGPNHPWDTNQEEFEVIHKVPHVAIAEKNKAIA